MKKLVLIVTLLFTAYVSAQTIALDRKSITVYGSAELTTINQTYKVDVTLSIDNGYYADNPYSTLAELKEKYFEEVKKIGIDQSKFEQDDLAFAASGYRKGGTVLHFLSDDKEEITKVANIKMTQATPSYVQMKANPTQEEIIAASKKSMKNAKKNADVLAEAADVEVGEVLSISSYDVGQKNYWASASSSTTDYVRVTVVYAIKE